MGAPASFGYRRIMFVDPAIWEGRRAAARRGEPARGRDRAVRWLLALALALVAVVAAAAAARVLAARANSRRSLGPDARVGMDVGGLVR